MRRLLRMLGRTLSILLPGPASRIAGWLFSRPKRGKVRETEAPVLAAAERFSYQIDGVRIEGYAWGEGPVLFGAHGWGSRGSRFYPFVQRANSAGYRFVTWDAPAHGDSGGRTTNAPTIARMMRTFLDRIGGIHAIVAHSLGCWATALALQQGLEAERAVFISPPGDLDYFSRSFLEELGFGEEVHRRMEERFERLTGIPWSHFTAEGLSRGQTTPLLVIHDHDDPRVPVEQARALAEAWPAAAFEDTTGLGHGQILRDEAVIALVMAFLDGTA